MGEVAVLGVGLFAVILGLIHFTLPRRFGFSQVILETGQSPPEFRLGPYRQELQRSDLRGMVYVMNHAASFVILSIGVFDLFAMSWWTSWQGAAVSTWAAVFWWVRAAAQLHVGLRRGDLFVMGWFAMLGLLQLAPLLDPA